MDPEPTGSEVVARQSAHAIDVAACPADVDPDVAAIGPFELGEPSLECRRAQLPLLIALGIRHQHADTSHRSVLLRPRHHRPHRRATKPRDEFPSSH
jgi:hypothetical protein